MKEYITHDDIEFWVNSVAGEIVDAARERDGEDWYDGEWRDDIHESVDGSSYVIYYYQARAVVDLMSQTEEDEAMSRLQDMGYQFGEGEHDINGLDRLYTLMAYCYLESEVEACIQAIHEAEDEED